MGVTLKANGDKVTWLQLTGFIVGMTVSIPLRGWAGALLWRWYAVPLGLPPISIPQWIGLTLIAAMFIGDRGIKPSEKSMGQSIGISFSLTLLCLFIGWVAHLFVA